MQLMWKQTKSIGLHVQFLSSMPHYDKIIRAAQTYRRVSSDDVRPRTSISDDSTGPI